MDFPVEEVAGAAGGVVTVATATLVGLRTRKKRKAAEAQAAALQAAQQRTELEDAALAQAIKDHRAFAEAHPVNFTRSQAVTATLQRLQALLNKKGLPLPPGSKRKIEKAL